MRRVARSSAEFPTRVVVRAFEGGAVYTAELGDGFFVIQDESTMVAFLAEDDLPDLLEPATTILEFDSRGERNAYLRSRGWIPE